MAVKPGPSLHVLLLAAAATIAAVAPASACAIPHRTATLLPTIPVLAYREPVVAKVEILELVGGSWWGESRSSSLARARVVASFKGIQVGQVIVINHGFGCDQSFFLQRDIGRQGYVAGGLVRNQDGETVFTGLWRMDERWGWWRKAY